MRRASDRRELARAVGKLTGAKLAPKPDFIQPCLATPVESAPQQSGYVFEIKHDGYRAQAHLSGGRGTIFTRRGYDWSDTFASIATAIAVLPAHEVVLDGEIVVLDDR